MSVLGCENKSPNTKKPPGLSASKTVSYALNLFWPILWKTRLEITRSYRASESKGFVKSCFRTEVLEAIPRDFILLAALSIDIPDMLPCRKRSTPVMRAFGKHVAATYSRKPSPHPASRMRRMAPEG